MAGCIHKRLEQPEVPLQLKIRVQLSVFIPLALLFIISLVWSSV
ncbi:MAG TPA: hypothetical protein VJJ20_01770 [Candidatus Paceibacterota bacterium]